MPSEKVLSLVKRILASGYEYSGGGNIHIKPSHRGRLTELKKRTGKTESELYNDGNPAHKKMVVFARNSRKWHSEGGLLSLPDDIEYANKWDRISNARYTMANDALVRSGSDKSSADRLARILAAQSALEVGWVDTVRGNNYAGYMSNGKRMSFDSPAAFWDYHINNLDQRWPDWRNAKTVGEYLDVINNTALGLDTKEKFDDYNRNHRDAPVYIYAPDWDNENYLGKLQGIYDKYVSKYVKPMFDAGGLIRKYGKDKLKDVLQKRFATGGDKKNDALAKAIIDRVNQDEATKIAAEGAYGNRNGKMGEAPLINEDKYLGAAAASAYGLATVGLSGAGSALARGINWLGEKAMPSALLKSPVWKGATAKVLSSIAPYADAAALAYWSAQGANASREAKKHGDTIGSVTYGGLAALPVAMPIGMKAGRAINGVTDVVVDKAKAMADKPLVDNKTKILFSKYGLESLKQGISNIKKYKGLIDRKTKFGSWDYGLKFARDKYASKADILNENFIRESPTPISGRAIAEADVLNELPKYKINNPLVGIFDDANGRYYPRTGLFATGKPKITINPYSKEALSAAYNNPMNPYRAFDGIMAHEGTHWALDRLATFNGTRKPKIPTLSVAVDDGYYIANRAHPLYPELTWNFDNAPDKWESSPEEFVAELTNLQLMGRIPATAPYDSWPVVKQGRIGNYMGRRFDMTPEDAMAIARDLSKFGYNSGGMLSLLRR